MSIKLMTAIWDNDDQRLVGHVLSLILAVADQAGEDGTFDATSHGIATLAVKTRTSFDGVCFGLHHLEKLGYVTIHPDRSGVLVLHEEPVGLDR